MDGSDSITAIQKYKVAGNQTRHSYLVTILSIGAILANVAAFFMKRSVYEANRESWNSTDSMPHQFAIGFDLLFQFYPLILLGGGLTFAAMIAFSFGIRNEGRAITVRFPVIWTIWAVSAVWLVFEYLQ